MTLIESIGKTSLAALILLPLIAASPALGAVFSLENAVGGALLAHTGPGGSPVKPSFTVIGVAGDSIVMAGREVERPGKYWGNFTIAAFNMTTGSIDMFYTLKYLPRKLGSDDLDSIGFGFMQGAATRYVVMPLILPNGMLQAGQGKLVFSAELYWGFLNNGGIIVIDTGRGPLSNTSVTTILINNSLSTVTGLHAAPGGGPLLVTGSAKGRGMLALFDPEENGITRAYLLYIEVLPPGASPNDTVTLSIVDDAYYGVNNTIYVAGRYFSYNTSSGRVRDKGVFLAELAEGGGSLECRGLMALSAPLSASDPGGAMPVMIEPAPGGPGTAAFVVPLNSTVLGMNWATTVIGVANITSGRLISAMALNATPTSDVEYPIEELLAPAQFERRADGSYVLLLSFPGMDGSDRGYASMLVLDSGLSSVERAVFINRTIVHVLSEEGVNVSLEMLGLFPGPSAWPLLVGDYLVSNRTGSVSLWGFESIGPLRNATLAIDPVPALDVEEIRVWLAIDDLPNATVTRARLSLSFSLFRDASRNVSVDSRIESFPVSPICGAVDNASIPVYGPSGVLYGDLLCSYGTLVFTNTTVSNVSAGNYTIRFEVARKSIIAIAPPEGVELRAVIVNGSTVCSGGCENIYNGTSGLYEVDPNSTVIILLSPPPEPVVGGSLVAGPTGHAAWTAALGAALLLVLASSAVYRLKRL